MHQANSLNAGDFRYIEPTSDEASASIQNLFQELSRLETENAAAIDEPNAYANAGLSSIPQHADKSEWAGWPLE